MTHDPQPITKSLSRYWLLIGVAALAVAGLFSLVLVVARTPSLSKLPFFDMFFHKALVVHVDLSVLVWFMAVACLLWSLLAGRARMSFPYLEEAALISFGLGTLALTLSPLDPNGAALMSNYIPVLTSPIFFLGLALLCCGVGLMLVKLFLSTWSNRLSPYVRPLVFSGGLIAVVALMAFIWSYRQLAANDDKQAYYELLFWGGGHVLQFVHAQMVMACWLLLMIALRPSFLIKPYYIYGLMAFGLALALAVPGIYMEYNAGSAEQRQFFTRAMIAVNGIGPLLLALIILPRIYRPQPYRDIRTLWSALVMSILLFLYGGLLGHLIEGQNVVIPAHYHGSIVGVTLAFMGVAYLLLPSFGYRNVAQWKMAFWQPVVYGGGQFLHISGLAWSGGYGVLRKTPGGLDALPTSVKAAMGLMGLGGLIAIIGGFMFVIVIWRAVRSPRLSS